MCRFRRGYAPDPNFAYLCRQSGVARMHASLLSTLYYTTCTTASLQRSRGAVDALTRCNWDRHTLGRGPRGVRPTVRPSVPRSGGECLMTIETESRPNRGTHRTPGVNGTGQARSIPPPPARPTLAPSDLPAVALSWTHTPHTHVPHMHIPHAHFILVHT